MKLATFEANGTVRVGAVVTDGIVDLSEIVPDMISLIAQWPSLRDKVIAMITEFAPHFSVDDVRLLAPVPRPGKIMAIGLNYADHVAESGVNMPQKQIWFSKMETAINGPRDPIEIPRVSSAIDYEAEMVAVIGRRCRHVHKDQAAAALFGFACGNDVSVRDFQFHSPQWVVGKSFDTHAPVGPWITTSDEVGDPHALDIRCYVNNEKRQDSNTRNLIFNVYDQIAYLSQAMTLEPGDLIFTGTPGGVGQSMTPPRFLQVGDIVRIEIQKLGSIQAKMVSEG